MLLVGFRIGEERYALRGRDVEEVIPRVSLRTIPLAPRGVAGLFNYRGDVTPVIDLGVLLYDTPVRDALSSRILLVRVGEDSHRRRIGLLAEKVTDILQESESLQETLRIDAAPFLGGAIACGNSMVQIVEPQKLLSDDLWHALFPRTEEA